MTLTQVTKAGLHTIALDHVFTIGASGTDHYTFQGEGLNGTVNDPTLYLTRGKTYRFENGTGAHAIRIQSADNGTNGTLYNTGVTNNNTTGTVIVEVQHDAPDVLYYQCAAHANMKGTIYITGALADDGVTTAKLAADAVTAAKLADNAVVTANITDDAVTDAKLANSINSAIAANTAKNTNATHTGDVTGSGSLTIASNAVTTAKIADDAITTAKIAANQVTSNELAGDAVSTGNIADNAVSSGKIQSSAVTTAKIADDAVTADKLANSINSAISANTAKTTNATHTGDVTGSTSLTLAASGVSAGSYGSSSAIPVITVDAKGRVTAASTAATSSDLVADTTPQLGGNLDGNGNTIDLSGNTDSMILPKGTTAQRDGSPVAGELRFNTSINAAELYNGSDWAKVGSTVVEVDYIVLAGGGAGGSYYRGGGGGAGGYRSSGSAYGNSGGGAAAEDSLELTKSVSYSVIVGAGGVGTNSTSTSNPGASGSNSKFHTIESIGGKVGLGGSTVSTGLVPSGSLRSLGGTTIGV